MTTIPNIQLLQQRFQSGKPVRILFVCLGNICRSPAAQGIMQDIIDKNNTSHLFHLDSAGLYHGHKGELPDHRMRIHAARRGYNLTHRSRPVQEDDFDKFDIIIGMDDNNIHGLKKLSPTIPHDEKIMRMTQFSNHPHYQYIPDPYYEGAQGFELVLDLLEDACLNLYNQITSPQ